MRKAWGFAFAPRLRRRSRCRLHRRWWGSDRCLRAKSLPPSNTCDFRCRWNNERLRSTNSGRLEVDENAFFECHCGKLNVDWTIKMNGIANDFIETDQCGKGRSHESFLTNTDRYENFRIRVSILSTAKRCRMRNREGDTGEIKDTPISQKRTSSYRLSHQPLVLEFVVAWLNRRWPPDTWRERVWPGRR